MLKLRKGEVGDTSLILQIQKAAFLPLYHRYKDEKNPIFMDHKGIRKRIEMQGSCYYLIEVEEQSVGFIRVIESKSYIRISPIAIFPQYQGCGYGKSAMLAVEDLYPQVSHVFLDTIAQEEILCRFYEKLGYTRLSTFLEIKAGMTLVDYQKVIHEKNR